MSSLFTHEAVQVRPDSLAERTPDRVAELLDKRLPTSAMVVNSMKGAAMGSTVSAVVANLYMEVLALETAPSRPKAVCG